ASTLTHLYLRLQSPGPSPHQPPHPPHGRLLPPRAPHLGRKQQAAATEQCNELTPLAVEHRGLPPLCVAPPTGRAHSLPHLQPAAGRPASPWGKPEMF